MSKNSPEMSPAKIIANQALDDLDFQREMVTHGLAIRDNEGQINFFVREARGLLTASQNDLLNAFEPFGYLTNLSRLTQKPEISHLNDNSIRSTLYRIRNRLEPALSNSPVYERMEESKSASFIGIGASTEIDPTTLALAHLFYTGRGFPLSSQGIADQLFPYPGEPEDISPLRQVTVAISRLRNRVPNKRGIVTISSDVAGEFPSYQWKNFGV